MFKRRASATLTKIGRLFLVLVVPGMLAFFVATHQSYGLFACDSTQEKEQNSISPDVLIKKMKSIGIQVDGIRWKKSKLANYWIAQMRVWNNDTGYVAQGQDQNGRLNNEVVVQIKGKSKDEISEFYVEAEIHDFISDDQKVKTLAKAFEALEQFRPKWPKSVKDAILEKKDVKIGHWTVRFNDDSVIVVYQQDLKWEHNEK